MQKRLRQTQFYATKPKIIILSYRSEDKSSADAGDGLAMPKRMGAEMRELVMVEDRSQLQLERNVWSSTGFKHVIKVGQKFQARLQVPGDGRGGSKKRRQHALPGLFDTAEDAAVMLAVTKRGFSSEGDGKVHSPLKQNKAHKSRAKPAKLSVPAQLAFEPVQSPVATAMAVPVPFWVQNAPVVAVTALPMQPLCSAPLLSEWCR